MADKIQNAYKDSKDIYDDVLTQRSFLSRLYIKFFWGGTDDKEIARKVLSYIPDDFEGEILDVPVGTAVFTEEKWKRLTHSKITCLDYSEDMLYQARKRITENHVNLIKGDVGNLEMGDEKFDIVLSMNGFHAFPDKNKAFSETYRVLKKGGKFIACFYIKGQSRKTDWLVKNILSKKGWFTPPFQTEDELRELLSKYYSKVNLQVDGSMAYLECEK